MIELYKNTLLGKVPLHYEEVNISELDEKIENIKFRILFHNYLRERAGVKLIAAQGNIAKLKVPVPPAHIQMKIVQTAQKIREEIKLLQDKERYIKAIKIDILEKIIGSEKKTEKFSKFLSEDLKNLIPIKKGSKEQMLNIGKDQTKNKVKKGDIFFNRLGRRFIIFNGENIHWRLPHYKVVLKTNNNPYFILNILNYSISKEYGRLTRSLPLKDIKEMKIPRLGAEKMKKYGRVFELMDREIELIDEKIVLLKRNKLALCGLYIIKE